MLDKFKILVSYSYWSLLMAICISIAGYGFSIEQPVLYFNFAYFFLIVSVWGLETWIPHEKIWKQPDGQNFANIAHTLTSKLTVQVLFFSTTVISLGHLLIPMSEPGYGIWPREAPILLQVIMGLVIGEFGLYWAHRLGHENKWLWQFHAVHHSVTKLWWLNTGRFHFIDSLVSIAAALGLFLILGAPKEVIQWFAAITAFVGILTHCNIQTRAGWLGYIFNTPNMHRWHHSKQLREGNKNYGENLLIWDLIFGTWFDENRRPPSDIGIVEYMPKKFSQQIVWPFASTKWRKFIYQDYTPKPFTFYDSRRRD